MASLGSTTSWSMKTLIIQQVDPSGSGQHQGSPLPPRRGTEGGHSAPPPRASRTAHPRERSCAAPGQEAWDRGRCGCEGSGWGYWGSRSHQPIAQVAITVATSGQNQHTLLESGAYTDWGSCEGILISKGIPATRGNQGELLPWGCHQEPVERPASVETPYAEMHSGAGLRFGCCMAHGSKSHTPSEHPNPH